MSPADIIILILAILCVGGAIAFAVIRKKRCRAGCGRCTGCSQHSACDRTGKR